MICYKYPYTVVCVVVGVGTGFHLTISSEREVAWIKQVLR